MSLFDAKIRAHKLQIQVIAAYAEWEALRTGNADPVEVCNAWIRWGNLMEAHCRAENVCREIKAEYARRAKADA